MLDDFPGPPVLRQERTVHVIPPFIGEGHFRVLTREPLAAEYLVDGKAVHGDSMKRHEAWMPRAPGRFHTGARD